MKNKKIVAGLITLTILANASPLVCNSARAEPPTQPTHPEVTNVQVSQDAVQIACLNQAMTSLSDEYGHTEVSQSYKNFLHIPPAKQALADWIVENLNKISQGLSDDERVQISKYFRNCETKNPDLQLSIRECADLGDKLEKQVRANSHRDIQEPNTRRAESDDLRFNRQIAPDVAISFDIWPGSFGRFYITARLTVPNSDDEEEFKAWTQISLLDFINSDKNGKLTAKTFNTKDLDKYGLWKDKFRTFDGTPTESSRLPTQWNKGQTPKDYLNKNLTPECKKTLGQNRLNEVIEAQYGSGLTKNLPVTTTGSPIDSSAQANDARK